MRSPITAASLTLIGFVSGQVVVTVTSTVTVLTVTNTLTYTPTTSTSTIVVSVTGTPPVTKSTSTETVTVTASTTTPVATAGQWPCPQIEFGQCGGEGYQGKCAGNCTGVSVCKYKDVWYSYCSSLPAVVNEITTVYLG